MVEAGPGRTLKLTLEYDGANFVGWQRQARGVSIQQVLEEALTRIEGSAVRVIGAGRTDAGVHALGQVASVHLCHSISVEALRRALNSMLPSSVRIVNVEIAAERFHARYDATGKTYRYYLWNGEFSSPFLARYAWHVPGRLDVDVMRTAARAVEGSHDFAAFQGAGSSVATTVRTIARSMFLDRSDNRSVDLSPMPRAVLGIDFSKLFIYEVSGDGFLRHMVRNIVGTLAAIGQGRLSPTFIVHLLRARDRRLAGPTAPAHGLWLVRVDYEKGSEGSEGSEPREPRAV